MGKANVQAVRKGSDCDARAGGCEVTDDQRDPLPVDGLVGALQDRIHSDFASVRAAKSFRAMTDDQREAYEDCLQ